MFGMRDVALLLLSAAVGAGVYALFPKARQKMRQAAVEAIKGGLKVKEKFDALVDDVKQGWDELVAEAKVALAREREANHPTA
ncbi:MAG TPA: hypothetical protein EYP10_15640 [Armatimonadetes bacterium]|nr:hypothetical protein [Armatimonadota bacterium]